MDPDLDPGGPKTYGFGSATLPETKKILLTELPTPFFSDKKKMKNPAGKMKLQAEYARNQIHI
jgi:hypothetical protein